MLRAILARELRSKDCRSPAYNQRGQSSGCCRLCRGLDKALHVDQTALLVRVQCSRKSMYMVVEGTSVQDICLLDDPWVILSTSKAFYYFCSKGKERS